MSKKTALLSVGAIFLISGLMTAARTEANDAKNDDKQTAAPEHPKQSANGSSYSYMPKKKLPDAQKQKAGQSQLEEEQRMDEGHANAD